MPGKNFGFVSTGANLVATLEQAMAQREAEKRQAMLDAAEAQEFALRQQEAQARIEAQRATTARQGRLDQQALDDRETAKRAAENKRNVYGMMGEAQTMPGGITPDKAKTIGVMATYEGMKPTDLPQEIQDILDPQYTNVESLDEQGNPIFKAYTQDELRKGVPRQKPGGAGGGRFINSRDGIYDTVKEQWVEGPGGGGGAGTPSQTYKQLTESRLFTAIQDLEPMISDDTVGTWRARGYRLEPFMPGQSDPTVDFDAALAQIHALIGFSELNAMRQASPTGGALGNVTERELAYLQQVAGTLDPNQSQAAFRRQLAKVRAEVERVVNFGLGGAVPGGAEQAPKPPPQDARPNVTPGREVGEIRRYPNGKIGEWDGNGWVDVTGADQPATEPGADAEPEPMPDVGTIKRFPNGRVGRWDGQGWVAQ